MIAQQEGGVGRTTTANVAVLLAQRGARVLVVDTDPQFTLTRQLGSRSGRSLRTGDDGTTSLRRIRADQDAMPLECTLAWWWLDQRAPELFLPLRDGRTGTSSYAGRRICSTPRRARPGGSSGRS